MKLCSINEYDKLFEDFHEKDINQYSCVFSIIREWYWVLKYEYPIRRSRYSRLRNLKLSPLYYIGESKVSRFRNKNKWRFYWTCSGNVVYFSASLLGSVYVYLYVRLTSRLVSGFSTSKRSVFFFFFLKFVCIFPGVRFFFLFVFSSVTLVKSHDLRWFLDFPFGFYRGFIRMMTLE